MALPVLRCLMLALLILGVFAAHHQATASRMLSRMSMAERHELWMAKHNRVYKDAEEKARRFEVFKANIELIKSFNAGNHKFKLEANQFADLTTDEFKEICSGFQPPLMTSVAAAEGFIYDNVTDVPSSMDWRTKGAVTPVKHQGHCGSCWAFSAVAAMEGLSQLKTGSLIALSEQELIDCDTSGENQGCNGGQMTKAFDFVANNEGLSAETSYPYRGKTYSDCHSEKSFNHAFTINGYEFVPSNNEAALLKAVANQPVSVAVDARGFAFQFYSSGVLTGHCGTDLNHAMTIVGYDTAADGTKYWILKNSWGSSWGESGYIRMERDVDEDGLCGIAMQASYPTA